MNNSIKILVESEIDTVYLEKIIEILTNYGLFLDTINFFNKIIDKLQYEITHSKKIYYNEK